MAASTGKLIVGGAAVYLSYRVSNATIDSLAERSKFTDKTIAERVKQRPRLKRLSRSDMMDRASRAEFDVVVVGGEVRVSQTALDCAVSGLNTLIIDSEDFDSSELTDCDDRTPSGLGTLPLLKLLYTAEGLTTSEKLLALSEATSKFSYLKTAPHLSEVRRTTVLVPDTLKCVLEFLANKMAEVLANKAPQYTVRLSAWSPPCWYRPAGSGSLSYRLTDVLTDHRRLNLSLVLTAAHHGAVTLNRVEVRGVERREEGLTLALEDKLTGRLTEVRTKKLVRLRRVPLEEETHCFRVPGGLVAPGQGVSLPQEEIVISREREGWARACVGSCGDYREAFDKLRTAVGRVVVVRRGEVSSLPVRTVREEVWSVETSDGERSRPSLVQPLGLSPGETLLVGSHGWSPHLATQLEARYGLTQSESEELVRRYGDQAGRLAREVSTGQTRLQAEVAQACHYELCVTLRDLCKRLGLQREEDVNLAGGVMQELLGWSSTVRVRQVKESLAWLQSLEELDGWKRKTEELSEVELEDERFIVSQIERFKRMSGQDGTISHGEFEDYLEGEDSPSVEGSLTEDQLERVLRAVDVEQNGRYSQSEFLSLVKRIHVLTPEEVIEGHVNQLKLSNKRSKS